jgi:hypothetical protein
MASISTPAFSDGRRGGSTFIKTNYLKFKLYQWRVSFTICAVPRACMPLTQHGCPAPALTTIAVLRNDPLTFRNEVLVLEAAVKCISLAT